jgi:Ser/Thr protein kinase RdoA (MazF antagonist)
MPEDRTVEDAPHATDRADGEGTLPHDLLACFPALRAPRVQPLAGGLVHQTFQVDDGAHPYVLQRVSPIFAPEIHANIAAVSAHVRARGVMCPALLPAADGRHFVELGDGSRWRLMTRLAGVAFARCTGPAQARSAGMLIARFHSALADFDVPLHPLGIVLHDAGAHRRKLAALLETHASHRLHSEVTPLASRIAGAQATLAMPDGLPRRVSHGDLKLDNLLFAGESPPDADRAIAVIDLDTLSYLPLHEELGDAWRSWCNPGGESAGSAGLDLELFTAAAQGYLGAAKIAVEPPELQALASAVEHISLELATRFAADALEESYFGWDPTRFAARGEHNLVRARTQLSLAEDARRKRGAQRDILLRAVEQRAHG